MLTSDKSFNLDKCLSCCKFWFCLNHIKFYPSNRNVQERVRVIGCMWSCGESRQFLMVCGPSGPMSMVCLFLIFLSLESGPGVAFASQIFLAVAPRISGHLMHTTCSNAGDLVAMEYTNIMLLWMKLSSSFLKHQYYVSIDFKYY